MCIRDRFSRPRNFGWVDVRADEFVREVYAVAKGLIANNVEHGDRVVIMSETRYEWSVLDYACMAAGVVSVPVYPSSSTSQCEWIVRDSGAHFAVAEDGNHETHLATFLRDGEPEPDTAHIRRVLRINNGALDTLIEEGKHLDDAAVDERVERTLSSDVASLVYTSGTTGRPKAAGSSTPTGWPRPGPSSRTRSARSRCRATGR